MAKINWLALDSPGRLAQIVENSRNTPCIIFKHSTRCSLSSLAKHRLESRWSFDEQVVLPYFLDLIAFREVSNLAAEQFGVPHQSPQLLLINDGRCVYHASHLDIDTRELAPLIGAKEQQ